MEKQFKSDIAFTESVKAFQEQQGSRTAYEKMANTRDWTNKLNIVLQNFIAEIDSFYLATANLEGQPYIQHRGGPKGFLNVLDESTLAFADFSGNRQYISAGNLSDNPKVHLFLMDYPNRFRVKIWGEAYISTDLEVIEKLTDTNYKAKVERAMIIKITALDVNCPQHITPRYTKEEYKAVSEHFNKPMT